MQTGKSHPPSSTSSLTAAAPDAGAHRSRSSRSGESSIFRAGLLRSFMAAGIPLLLLCCSAWAADTLKLGSKRFTESYILAEIAAQAAAAHASAEHRQGLGNTAIVFEALKTGGIDLYPEYTGTSWTAVLGREVRPGSTSEATWTGVRDGYRARGMRVLRPTPFSNGNAIVVTRATAKRHGLRTLSDLARVSGELRFGAIPGFASRADGMPLLERVYDMRFGSVRSFQDSLKYAALADGAVDAVYGFETDGPIAARDLVVLADDRRAWPSYQAAPVVSSAFARRVGPDFAATLDHVSSLLDAKTMRALNAQVDDDGDEPEDVAHRFLAERGLVATRR